MDTHIGSTATHDLTVTRRFATTPAAVFAAWTEAEQIKQWWGPYGMTVPVAEIDLRPGGVHRTVMRDADGKEYPSLFIIEAITPDQRLVLRVADQSCGPFEGAVATVDLAREGELTRLDVRWRHPTAEMRATHLEMGFVLGWGQTLDKLAAHLAASPASSCPGGGAPQPQHGWLLRLLGDWTYEIEAQGPPGQPAMRARGVERVRALGGFWVIGESEGEMPGGVQARMVVTIGYDPRARRFRGSWVGSMMPQMFVYDGALDAACRTLTLDSEGPAMTGEGDARYRDVVELRDDDTRVVTSEMQGADGGWTRIMTATFKRRG